ncbi:MAG TPA: hypothetical protein VGS16_05435 [Candidatus Dormibacteraeota bacterium]|nr:hypothetical protein [Candidatus Dormibacteraeota bacterium]
MEEAAALVASVRSGDEAAFAVVISRARSPPGRLPSLQALIPKVIAAAKNALALSIGDHFWVTIVAGVLGLACCLMLRDRPLTSTAELRSGAASTRPVQAISSEPA